MIGVTGTDTDVGKTLTCSWIQAHTDAAYWKPVQTGEKDTGGDTATVQKRIGLPLNHYFKPAYHLRDPLSPHQAALREGVKIDLDSLKMPTPPQGKGLIVEGAGGVYVPVNQGQMIIDMFARFALPMLVVSRTTLGTINHTFLTIEALRNRGLGIRGVVFTGEENKEVMETIAERGKVQIIGHIPPLKDTSKETLKTIQPFVPFSRWFSNED